MWLYCKNCFRSFCFSLFPILNLGFSFPQSLNLQLLSPRSCLASQISCCQFNFRGFWHIIANKVVLNLVKPIHKFLMIQASIKFREFNFKDWIPSLFWFPWLEHHRNEPIPLLSQPRNMNKRLFIILLINNYNFSSIMLVVLLLYLSISSQLFSHAL